MNIYKTLGRKALFIGLLLLAFLVAGCAGIKPYKPRDDRREGPARGLYTGSQGEWVILGPRITQKDKEKKNQGQEKTESVRE
jgi:hypothetical protein